MTWIEMGIIPNTENQHFTWVVKYRDEIIPSEDSEDQRIHVILKTLSSGTTQKMWDTWHCDCGGYSSGADDNEFSCPHIRKAQPMFIEAELRRHHSPDLAPE